MTFQKRMRLVKPIKKTSALSPVSPLRWAEDLTHVTTGLGNSVEPILKKGYQRF